MQNRTELFRELQRLNRTGIINDEEAAILRKLLRERMLSGETKEQFDKLFPETKIIEPEPQTEDPYDFLKELFGPKIDE